VREREERYRSLVETAGSAILVISPEGRILEFNREAERVLGWSRAEAVGQGYAEFLRPEVRPDPAGVSSACAERPSHGLETLVVARDGSRRTLVCNTSPLVDHNGQAAGIIVCAQDITDRKRVEEALGESEARLRTVIANAPVVLFTVDRTGAITLSEGKGLARLGLAPGEVVGRRLVEVLDALGHDVTARYMSYFERGFLGEPASWMASLGEATFECRLAPIHDEAGNVSGVIGLAIDLTERKQAEDARLAIERRLLESQKLESLGVMAGGIAHDFNNLLMSVLGNASLVLADIPPGSPARRHLTQIEVAAQRGSDLTRQLLSYAGQGSMSIELVDASALIEETRELLRVSIGRNVTIDDDLEDDLPPIEADPSQIRQVIMNLLINAAEGIGDAQGKITVRTRTVDLDEATLRNTQHGPDSAPGPHVCIEVTDTGCGMDADTMERMFDPFFSTKFTGRGLGLATVLGVVRGHRGAVQVLSQPGSGTTFRIFFPCAPDDGARTAPSRAPRPAAPVSNGRARTVLLVDDEEDVRTVTQHMLERLGCSVLLAGDGQEGVDVFRAHAEAIDAVIVDLTLPRLRGDSACTEIRRIRPDARVILMSGYNDERTTQQLAAKGLSCFLRKPFSVDDLSAAMNEALGAAAQAAGVARRRDQAQDAG
jgi:two-component system, cell cycle sensor histidine kinase and response regulator CckA